MTLNADSLIPTPNKSSAFGQFTEQFCPTHRDGTATAPEPPVCPQNQAAQSRIAVTI
jgi:hypothetical protein